MKAATVHELKEELKHRSAAQLVELCNRLVRFKKENKELLTYLLFEAHDLNVQGEPLSIPLNEIAGVTTCNTLGVVPNGVRVRCRSGQQYQFVLWGRKRLIDLIEQQLPRIRF